MVKCPIVGESLLIPVELPVSTIGIRLDQVASISIEAQIYHFLTSLYLKDQFGTLERCLHMRRRVLLHHLHHLRQTGL